MKPKKQYLILLTAFLISNALIGHFGLTQDLDAEGVTFKARRFLPVNEDKTDLTPEEEIRNIAKQNGFRWTDYLVRLANCESTLNKNAKNDNGFYGLDRGIFQINDHFHPEVSDECAYDIKCSTEWTMWRINSGHQKEWMCDKLI